MGSSCLARLGGMLACLLVSRGCCWVYQTSKKTDYRQGDSRRAHGELVGTHGYQPGGHTGRLATRHSIYTIDNPNVTTRLVSPHTSYSISIASSPPIVPHDRTELWVQRRGKVQMGGTKGSPRRSQSEPTAGSYEPKETVWECFCPRGGTRGCL
jgi:hypothetical protein